MKVAAIIPARYASSRFPGKVLHPLAGKTMIQRVWERTRLARSIDVVLIATDDERIAKVVTDFGGQVVMTRTDHASGTERVAEAADKIEADVIINVQGDEPIINPESLDLVAGPLKDDGPISMSSLMIPIQNHHDYLDPNVVKVICDDQNNAIYFSRSPLPFYRDHADRLEDWAKGAPRPPALKPPPMKHIGVYAYRAGFLQAMARMPSSELELAERLEQLKVLAWGFNIRMVQTPHDAVSVDTPEDAAKVEAIIKRLEA